MNSVYDGLFWCHIRKGFFRWPEYIAYYKGMKHG